jgi:hypothetical protein
MLVDAAQRYSDRHDRLLTTIAAKVVATARARGRPAAHGGAHLRAARFLPERGAAVAAPSLVGPRGLPPHAARLLRCVTILGFWMRVAVRDRGDVLLRPFAAKVLVVRDRSLPSWALPAAGLTLASMLLVLWLTSSLWYFTNVRVGF